VRTIEVQGGVEHGAVPSSHHVRSLIAVNDPGVNPEGTGPEGALNDPGFDSLGPEVTVCA
jgi:hypothetical protein